MPLYLPSVPPIYFPATAVADTNANALDDYEEGEWTAAVTFATPGNLSVVHSASLCRYTKVGRLVTVMGRVQTSTFTHTTASGAFHISGLPFTTINANPGAGSCAFRGSNLAQRPISLRVLQNGTTIEFQIHDGAAALATLTIAHVPTGGTVDIVFAATYDV